MFKVNGKNTRMTSLTGVLFLVFLLLALNKYMLAGIGLKRVTQMEQNSYC